MLTYIFKVALCWGIFYLIYYALLRRETFFRLNRWYLMGTLLLGLAIPAIEFDLLPKATTEAVYYLQPVTIGVEQFEAAIVSASGQEAGFDFWKCLIWIYWAGVALACMRFGYGLYQIGKLYTSGTTEQVDGYILVTTTQPHIPFSFFKNLFWSQYFTVEEEDRRSILRHEEAHIFQHHSLDVMLLELAGILCWCVPFIYLYKKAVKTTHEYLADDYVTAGFSKKEYGRLLLRHSQPTPKELHWSKQIAISNSLFSSQLKQRIVMMTKNKSSQRAALKYFAILPALALLFLAFSPARPLPENAPIAETSDFPALADTLPTDMVYKKVDELPRFPGCEEITDASERLKCSQTKMLEFVYRNIKYPETAKNKGTQGMAVAKFTVEVNGSISEVEVVRDPGDGIGEEVKRVIQEMPKWIPGKVEGVAVRTQFNLPVKFKLDDEDKKEASTSADTAPEAGDSRPLFAGCATSGDKEACSQEKLLAFIIENMKYPEQAKQARTEGLVVVKFLIGEDGAVQDAQVIKGIGGGCDEEALRIVNAMPNWTPGRKDGKTVQTELSLPFRFALPPDEGTADKGLHLLDVFPNPTSGDSFSVRFKAEPGQVSILFRDAAGKDVMEKTFKDYDGSERTEPISTKGLFENKTGKGTFFVTLLDAKGRILGTRTLIVQ